MSDKFIIISVENARILETIRRLRAKLVNTGPLMKQISAIMLQAVEQNFEEEGRPKWPALKYKREKDAKILQKSGGLAASVQVYADKDVAIVYSNKVYAAIHQFGGTTKPHVIKARRGKLLSWPGARYPVKQVNHPGSVIPARPFLKLADEDIQDIQDAVDDFIRP